jgi:hypothetical protein
MTLKTLAYAGLAALITIPSVASAQVAGDNLDVLLTDIVGFINVVLIPFIWAIAFIVFIWGVFQYFIAGGANEEQRDKGKQLVIWGVIAFVVMSSLWGIVNLFRNTIIFGDERTPPFPSFEDTRP